MLRARAEKEAHSRRRDRHPLLWSASLLLLLLHHYVIVLNCFVGGQRSVPFVSHPQQRTESSRGWQPISTDSEMVRGRVSVYFLNYYLPTYLPTYICIYQFIHTYIYLIILIQTVYLRGCVWEGRRMSRIFFVQHKRKPILLDCRHGNTIIQTGVSVGGRQVKEGTIKNCQCGWHKIIQCNDMKMYGTRKLTTSFVILLRPQLIILMMMMMMMVTIITQDQRTNQISISGGEKEEDSSNDPPSSAPPHWHNYQFFGVCIHLLPRLFDVLTT